ncbi:Synaptonemal complex protein 3, partial [Stegodyphus mimosarum]
MEKLKEAEDKLQKVLLQQQKHQQQIRISHAQRIKTLKNLNDEFCKGMTELEESHIEQYSLVHSELRKEMALLQKKILMDIQQQEMMNVRKHLK